MLPQCDCRPMLSADNTTLLSNPDIAGIGVLVGVTVPALAVFVMIFFYYIFFVPDDDELCAPLDRIFLARRRRKGAPRGPRWLTADMLRRFILFFSDTQLVNGFAMLASGYILGCSVSNYHWQILVECVWFTSATHLATIPILRSYLAEPHRKVVVWVRVGLMTIIFLMLAASFIPTGHSEWLNVAGMPAMCYFNYSYDDQTSEFSADDGDEKLLIESPPTKSWGSALQALLLAWSLGLLAFVYFRQGLRLIRRRPPPGPSQTPGQGAFRTPPLNKTLESLFGPKPSNETLTARAWAYLLVYVCILIAHLCWHSLWKLFESFAWHVMWLAITLTWGLYVIVYNKWYFHFVTTDDEWTFGQFLPLFLVMLSVIGIVGIIFEEPKTLKHPDGQGGQLAVPHGSLPRGASADDNANAQNFEDLPRAEPNPAGQLVIGAEEGGPRGEKSRNDSQQGQSVQLDAQPAQTNADLPISEDSGDVENGSLASVDPAPTAAEQQQRETTVLIAAFFVLEIWFCMALLMGVYFVSTPYEVGFDGGPGFIVPFLLLLFLAPAGFTAGILFLHLFLKLPFWPKAWRAMSPPVSLKVAWALLVAVALLTGISVLFSLEFSPWFKATDDWQPITSEYLGYP